METISPYGMRKKEPNNTGVAVSQNNCWREKLKPASFNRSGMADHMNQTANARAKETALMAKVRQANAA